MKIKNQDKKQVQTFLQIEYLDLPQGTVEEKEMSEISGGYGGTYSNGGVSGGYGPGYWYTIVNGQLYSGNY